MRVPFYKSIRMTAQLPKNHTPFHVYTIVRGQVRNLKDAKLAQKLGQLQPFTVVSPQEGMGQLASFGPT
jgi:hypothetical protein